MRRLLRWLLLVPIAILLVLFSVANRAPVTLSFDPFSREAPALAVSLPLFVMLMVVLALGVLIGGTAAGIGRLRWRWRWRARQAEREASRLAAQNEAFLHSVRTEPSDSRNVALR
jgi:uncharacterized integral membrane protein